MEYIGAYSLSNRNLKSPYCEYCIIFEGKYFQCGKMLLLSAMYNLVKYGVHLPHKQSQWARDVKTTSYSRRCDTTSFWNRTSIGILFCLSLLNHITAVERLIYRLRKNDRSSLDPWMTDSRPDRFSTFHRRKLAKCSFRPRVLMTDVFDKPKSHRHWKCLDEMYS